MLRCPCDYVLTPSQDCCQVSYVPGIAVLPLSLIILSRVSLCPINCVPLHACPTPLTLVHPTLLFSPSEEATGHANAACRQPLHDLDSDHETVAVGGSRSGLDRIGGDIPCSCPPPPPQVTQSAPQGHQSAPQGHSS